MSRLLIDSGSLSGRQSDGRPPGWNLSHDPYGVGYPRPMSPVLADRGVTPPVCLGEDFRE
jgi:hypothetical protein